MKGMHDIEEMVNEALEKGTGDATKLIEDVDTNTGHGEDATKRIKLQIAEAERYMKKETSS